MSESTPQTPETVTCNSFKWGEYNPLRCCLEKWHSGEHNYVVLDEETPMSRVFYGERNVR